MPQTPTSRRRTAKYTDPPAGAKYRDTPEQWTWVLTKAEMLDWSPANVIRKCVEIVRQRGLL